MIKHTKITAENRRIQMNVACGEFFEVKMSHSYTVKYPSIHPGTDSTQILFFEGQPDLVSLFFRNEKCGNADLTHDCARRLFVTDKTIAQLPDVKPFINEFNNGKRGKDLLFILGAGEKYKTIESVLSIVRIALENNFNRRDIFVGIGGGVITDMTAFAASMFKRGAKAEFVSTTLLGMVDAAVGGKTGCDFESFKNMIGAFYPAQKLYIFPQFVQSLSADEYRSGFAEVIKTAFLYSKDLYEFIKENRQKILERNPEVLQKIITECVKAKANVVEKDFTEKNIRMHLNLGHTFGHALESTAGLGKVSHGDAVAWGMARAACLSAELGLCTTSYRDEIIEILKFFGWETGANHPAQENTPNSAATLLDAMKKDKKNSSDKIRFVLQKGIAQNVITEVDDEIILKVL